MALHEIKVEIPASTTDLVDEVLQESGEGGWSILEDAIAKRAWVVGIFPTDDERARQWAELGPKLPAPPLGEPVRRVLADEDWRDSYKAHFHAWRFGRLHWVPVWERASFALPAGDSVLWLDPGLAFGTGNHETTRLCVERLVALAEQRGVSGNVIDAGCGSGILALSAALLGYREVVGFDNDSEAIRVSGENAALNSLADRVEFFTGDLVGGLAGRQGEVLLANIQADVLMRFSRELIAGVRSGGTLILSGILAMERDRVRAHFSAAVPEWQVASRVMGEWSDVVLTRPVRSALGTGRESGRGTV